MWVSSPHPAHRGSEDAVLPERFAGLLAYLAGVPESSRPAGAAASAGQRPGGGGVRGPGRGKVPGRDRRVGRGRAVGGVGRARCPAGSADRCGRAPDEASGRPGGQVHLHAVMDHAARAVLGQVDVAGNTNEITAFRPLLSPVDLARTVVTADALHTQREHADWLVTAKKAAYICIVKRNQPGLYRQLKALRGGRCPPATTPARVATAGTRSAACRSSPSPACRSHMQCRPSGSPAEPARGVAGAGAP